MKLIQITTGLDQKSGGPFYFANELAELLFEGGFNIESLTFGGFDEISPAKEFSSLDFRRNRNGLFSIPRLCQLKRLRSANFLLFHGFYVFPIFWVLVGTKGRIVVIPHGSISEYQHRKAKIRKAIFRKVFSVFNTRNRVSFYVASEQERDDVLTHFPTMPVTSLGLWVRNCHLSQARHDLDRQKNICVISRLHPIKNIENLLIAFDQIRRISELDYKLLIAGDGDDSYVRFLKSKVSELGLNSYVKFLGHLDENEKNDLWEVSDLLCQISFYENFGQVVAESVMHGVPVVISKQLGISSTIEMTGTGLLVDPENIQEITQAILDGLSNYAQLRSNCIRYRKVFSKEQVAKRWIRQIELDSLS